MVLQGAPGPPEGRLGRSAWGFPRATEEQRQSAGRGLQFVLEKGPQSQEQDAIRCCQVWGGRFPF